MFEPFFSITTKQTQLLAIFDVFILYVNATSLYPDMRNVATFNFAADARTFYLLAPSIGVFTVFTCFLLLAERVYMHKCFRCCSHEIK